MKKILFSLLILFTFTNIYAQKRTVEVTAFSKLSLGIPAQVYLKQGTKNTVEIDCDEEIFNEIKFLNSGNQVRISKEKGYNWRTGWKNSDVKIYVTMEEITDLDVSGSGHLEGENFLKVDELDLSISGSGHMSLKAEGNALEMHISGSGNIELEGKFNEAKANISGSGKVKAEELTVAVFNASISGSGSCYITATEEIDARTSGSGSVYYKGEPKNISSKSSGSGKVKKMM